MKSSRKLAFAVLLNVFIVSAFISFTRFKHPPATALTIFSYIIHTTIALILASAVVIGVIISSQLLVSRINRRFLKDDQRGTLDKK